MIQLSNFALIGFFDMAQPERDYYESDRQKFLFLKQLGYEPKVIFDVGASNGAWSSSIYPALPEAEYHLFEPLIDSFTQYSSIMDYVLKTYPNFKLHKYALGEQSGEITMNAFPNLAASTALNIGTNTEVTQIPVKMLSIDEAVDQLQLPQPQVIKIDTQGCELSILKGAQMTLDKVEVLLLECWLVRGYGQNTPLLVEIANWLQPFNFYLWDITDEYRDEKGCLITLDCFFLKANLGIHPESSY